MMFRLVTFVLFISLIRFTGSDKTTRKKELPNQYETFDIFPLDTLPSDKQVTSFLKMGIKKSYYFWSTVDNGSLSITVTTCLSPVQWTFSVNQNNSHDTVLKQPFWTVDDVLTTHLFSIKGLYRFEFISLKSDTYLNIYTSTENGGPRVLKEAKNSKIYVHKRRKKILVKWHPSLVDPQNTAYCLVIHSNKFYKTLCRAELEKRESDKLNLETFNVSLQYPNSLTPIHVIPSKFGNGGVPTITCVGQKFQYLVENTRKDKTYFFSLFATNKQNNVTYLYGTTSAKGHLKHITLKDGKLISINLKKMDGKIAFSFKVSRFSDNILKLFVASCTSKIKLNIFNKRKVLLTKNITKYSIITLNHTDTGTRYIIRISKIYNQDIESSSDVQILASSAKDFIMPFPLMHPDTKIREYESLKSCNSITIGWYTPIQIEFGHYCFFVKEGQIKDTEERSFKKCGFQKVRENEEFIVQYCKNLDHRKQTVIIEKVRYLLPGKKYIVQVIVKKQYGKYLSYDLFQTHTLPSCSKL